MYLVLLVIISYEHMRVDKLSDFNGDGGTQVIRNDSEGCELQFGNCTIEFCEMVRSSF